MAIAYVSTAGFTEGNGTSIAAFSKPASTAIGDTLIAQCYIEHGLGETLTIASTGDTWTLVPATGPATNTTPTPDMDLWVWVCAVGNASSTIGVTWGGGAYWRDFAVHRFTGAHATVPLETSTENVGTSTTPTGTGLATGNAGRELVLLTANFAGTTSASWTAGLTERDDSGNLAMASGADSAGTDTANKTATLTSTSWAAVLLALRPAGAPVPATPVFCCGGECGRIGAGPTGVGEHWTPSNTTAEFTIDTTTVRSGARSIRWTAVARTNLRLLTGPTGAATATRVGRVYIRFATLPSRDAHLVGFTYGSTGAGVVFKASDSKLYSGVQLSGGAITFGASGVSVTTGVWYRLDYVTVGHVASGTSDVSVDGVACAQATAAFNSATATTPRLGADLDAAALTIDMYFDDYLGSETAIDYPLGAGKVEHFVPTSDGTHNVAGAADFKVGAAGADITNATTTAYQLIDEVPLDDTTADTNDYINIIAPPNATDYTEHVFGPASGISTPTTGPRAVEVIAGIHQAGTGTGNMEIRLNDNGTVGTVYTAAVVAGTTTLTYKRAHFADPPSAASVWHALNDGSNGDFRDLRVRLGSPSAGVDANPDQYLDCVMVEAEFAESAPSPTITVVPATATAAVLLPTVTAVQIVSASVTGVAATALAAVGLPTVVVARSVTGLAATATAAVPLPTVLSVRNALVGGVAATATAAVSLPTITAARIVSVTGVAATADAAVLSPAVAAQVSTSVTGVAATASAAVGTPAVSAVRIASVTGVAALVDAAVGTPSITAAVSVTVNAVPAESSAGVSTPTVTSVQIASVTAVPATASAAALLPTVTAIAAGSATVTGVPAESTAAAQTPAVTAQRIVSIAAVPAEASAAAQNPTIAAQVATTVSAVPATSDAAALAPSVTAARMVSVSSVPAEATAEVLAPTITVTAAGNVSVSAVPATADAAVSTPAVTAVVQTSVTAVPAEATGAVSTPVVTSQVQTSITAVPATADAAVSAPTVTVVAAGNTTVSAVPAEAPAVVLLPTVTATRVASVTAVPAQSTAQVLAPSVSAQLTASITSVIAEASAAVSTPTITPQRIVSISAVAATADASVPPPTVAGVVVLVALITAVPATADAQAQPPSLTGGVSVIVLAVVAEASALVFAPTLDVVRIATILAPPAEATATVLSPIRLLFGVLRVSSITIVSRVQAAVSMPAVFTGGATSTVPRVNAGISAPFVVSADTDAHLVVQGSVDIRR